MLEGKPGEFCQLRGCYGTLSNGSELSITIERTEAPRAWRKRLHKPVQWQRELEHRVQRKERYAETESDYLLLAVARFAEEAHKEMTARDGCSLVP